MASNNKVAVSDFSFPNGRRKTAPEIRKFTHTLFKNESEIINVLGTVYLLPSLFGRIEFATYFGYNEIDSTYIKNFFFDHRSFIQKYVVRIYIIPHLFV